MIRTTILAAEGAELGVAIDGQPRARPEERIVKPGVRSVTGVMSRVDRVED